MSKTAKWCSIKVYLQNKHKDFAYALENSCELDRLGPSKKFGKTFCIPANIKKITNELSDGKAQDEAIRKIQAGYIYASIASGDQWVGVSNALQQKINVKSQTKTSVVLHNGCKLELDTDFESLDGKSFVWKIVSGEMPTDGEPHKRKKFGKGLKKGGGVAMMPSDLYEKDCKQLCTALSGASTSKMGENSLCIVDHINSYIVWCYANLEKKSFENDVLPYLWYQPFVCAFTCRIYDDNNVNAVKWLNATGGNYLSSKSDCVVEFLDIIDTCAVRFPVDPNTITTNINLRKDALIRVDRVTLNNKINKLYPSDKRDLLWADELRLLLGNRVSDIFETNDETAKKIECEEFMHLANTIYAYKQDGLILATDKSVSVNMGREYFASVHIALLRSTALSQLVPSSALNNDVFGNDEIDPVNEEGELNKKLINFGGKTLKEVNDHLIGKYNSKMTFLDVSNISDAVTKFKTG